MTKKQSLMIENLYYEMFEKMKIYACCSLDNEALAEEAEKHPNMEILGKSEEMAFDENGRLL